jgi:pilus assembly protein CpaB
MRKIFLFFRNINRMWLLFALAVVLGLAAAMLVSSYLKGRESALMAEVTAKASGGPTAEVIAASVNITKGTVLSADNLSKRVILADLVNDEMLLVSDFERVDGVKAARPIQAGWPLRVADVIEKTKGIAEGLGDGMRAITIDVDEINSMAQMVEPGNRVDLMLIVPDGGSSFDGQKVVLVQQSVKVLATGQRLASVRGGAGPTAGRPGSQMDRYSNFTFEVTPQTAARIALAQQMGKIRAVLRGSNDVAEVTLGEVTTRSMLRMPPANYAGVSGGTSGAVRSAPSSSPAPSRRTDGPVAQSRSFSSNSPAGAAQRVNGVEYIIGGKGSTTPVNINIPSLFPSSLSDRNPFGAAPMPPSFVSPAGNPAFMPPAMGQSFEQQRP